MAKHEFGLMPSEPSSNERFDRYEPDKYNCIVIDDDFIEPLLVDLQEIDCYWHTRRIANKGLAYYGITLIPSKSMDALINLLSSKNKQEYTPLIELAMLAKKDGKYMIHFGI